MHMQLLCGHVDHRLWKTPRVTAAAPWLIMGMLGTTPAWPLRAAAEQFQLTGRGSCSGHEASHAYAYHGAGSNGSCAALGAMYAKKGRCGSVATVWRIQAMEVLPMTLVL